jgi:hypothetical protein
MAAPLFMTVKCQFRFRKTHDLSQEKNASQVNWLVGLANLYLLLLQLMVA